MSYTKQLKEKMKQDLIERKKNIKITLQQISKTAELLEAELIEINETLEKLSFDDKTKENISNFENFIESLETKFNKEGIILKRIGKDDFERIFSNVGFKTCLKQEEESQNVDNLKQYLLDGVCKVVYRKKDGTIRTFEQVTMNQEIIKQFYTFKENSTDKNRPENQWLVFDLIEKSWKNLASERITKIIKWII